MKRRELIGFLRTHFALDWQGVHGAPHWARVLNNGTRLARSTGARLVVVEAFALLHDSCRQDEWTDSERGFRAAEFARRINDRFLHFEDDALALLTEACEGHSDGQVEADITVQTCWDADRLDLGRVGIRPDPRRLCTHAARDPEMIRWAYARSVA